MSSIKTQELYRHGQPIHINSNAPNFSKWRKRWMPSDSADEVMEIRLRKSLKLLSIYLGHAERKQKAQFIEDPKHTHGGKQGVGGSLSESGGRRKGVGFYFCGLCFSPVHPPQSYFTTSL